MRVLYDVSVLGLSHGKYFPATGVSRVVDQVVDALGGLACDGRLDLELCASLPPYVLLSALAAVGERPSLAALMFRHAPVSPRVVRAIGDPMRRLLHAGGGSLAVKVARRALLLAMGALARVRPALTARELDGIDVYHSPFHGLPDVTRRPGVRRFLTVYDVIPMLFPEYVVARGEHFLVHIIRSLRPDDWVFAISERTKADLLNYRPELDPARVLVTPLAADPRLFRPHVSEEEREAVRTRYRIPSGRYLLSLNTLEPRKNLDRLVRAFTDLVRQQRLDDVSLVLVGAEGWRLERLLDALRDAGEVRDRIVLTGFVDDADLAALYGGATAFVYPSLYEGFGLPPLEAMQCGVPVIVSSTSSLPEVVGDAGLLVEPTDVDALASAMDRVLHDATLVDTLRRRSLARASLFTWERCAEMTLDGYRTAVSAGS